MKLSPKEVGQKVWVFNADSAVCTENVVLAVYPLYYEVYISENRRLLFKRSCGACVSDSTLHLYDTDMVLSPRN